MVDLPKGKQISVYDGHRTSMEGKVQLQCPRMVKLIQQYPELATVPFTKSHLMLVPGQTRIIVIAGAASAHPMLQTMPHHGDTGTGSCINSTQRTGIKPNCEKLVVTTKPVAAEKESMRRTEEPSERKKAELEPDQSWYCVKSGSTAGGKTKSWSSSRSA